MGRERDQASAINMGDPGVQRLLGTDQRVVTGKSSGRELVHVAGDNPPPDVRGPSWSDTTIRADRSAIGHPVYFIKGHGMGVADVYEVPGAPMYVVLICPKCHHALRISADRKKIDFERVIGAPNPSTQALARIDQTLRTASSTPSKGALQAFGKLSIEPFECTWEMGKDRGEFGATLCRWKAAIDQNIVKDA